MVGGGSFLTTRALLRLRGWWRYAERWRTSAAESRPPREDNDGERVRRAVGRLAVKYREPIVLRYFEEMPVDRIAEVLRISPGAVEVRLSRARARLKEILSCGLEESKP